MNYDTVVRVDTVEEANQVWFLECGIKNKFESLPYTDECCISIGGDHPEYSPKRFYVREYDSKVITYEKYLESQGFVLLKNFGTGTPEQVEVNSNAVNPKAQIGSHALPMGMISPLFSAHVALGKLNGAEKYGLANYIGTEVVMSIYLDAIQRHLDKIKMGEVVDEVDGVNHFGAIGANCDIILSAQAAGTLIDDRPLCTGQLEAYKALTPMVKQLKELHKEKNPRHYYAKDFK